jgi:hypothetical protein
VGVKKLHPAIRVIRALTLHIEHEFQTLTRGKKHTIPKKATDVKKLQKSYQASRFHNYTAGCTIKTKADCAVDYTTKGLLTLSLGRSIAKWVHGRSFECTTMEDWDIFSDDESESEQERSSSNNKN